MSVMDIEGLACDFGGLNDTTVLGFPPGSIIIRDLRIARPGGFNSRTTVSVSFELIDGHPHFTSRTASPPDHQGDP